MSLSVEDLAAHVSVDDIITKGQSDYFVGSDDAAEGSLGLREIVLVQVGVSAERLVVEGDGDQVRGQSLLGERTRGCESSEEDGSVHDCLFVTGVEDWIIVWLELLKDGSVIAGL